MEKIKTNADLERLLQLDKAIVFIFQEWSGQAHFSKRIVLDWESISQNKGFIFELNPELSIEFDKWVNKNKIHGNGYGSMVWLKKGKILGFIKEAGKLSIPDFERKTAEMFHF